MIETPKAEELDAVTRQINIWASIAHHQMAKGFGCPEIERCGIDFGMKGDPPHPGEFVGEDPTPDAEVVWSRDKADGLLRGTPREGVLIWDCGRSDDLYNASFRKYKPTGVVGFRNDPKSQLEGLVVECVLREVGYPPLLVGLLLWLYPTCGDFVPLRPNNWDRENPYRTYRPRRWVRETYGNLGDWRQEHLVDNLLKGVERNFRGRVRDALGPAAVAGSQTGDKHE